ncbi:MAG: ABC transporter ATP-binding protein [Puniceicoccales bacterium]|nr:ABC transporter ATP-binding protein [Puniceicoccales bacterium]
MNNNVYLSVQHLTISFAKAEDPMVYDVSFNINRGETLALVGESGSGKTLIAHSLMRLLPNVFISGAIIIDNQSILDAPISELTRIRRSKVSYIFQEPSSALNPVLTLGYQLLEVAKGEGKKFQVLNLLKRVGFRDPNRILNTYPHELSGGMQQRAMIAMALINRPQLFIADEPTTALDVVLQKQILNLIQSLQKEFNFTVLLITHDFSLLRQMAHRVCVIRRGRIVECGTPRDIILYPRHEYTKLLSQSILTLSESNRRG